ncbi:MAG: hypothetical protein JO019_04215 [Candidatus Kaiserbacteria bacterium]|nr:hypothetical protein [Candidatus Kaiserbacteria bacterium]
MTERWIPKADYDLAEQRIVHGINAHLAIKRPLWKPILYRMPYRVSNPKWCVIATLETAYALDTESRDAVETAIKEGRGISFHEAMRRLGITFEEAVASGFARAPSDSIFL